MACRIGPNRHLQGALDQVISQGWEVTALMLHRPLSGARPSTSAVTSHLSAPQPVRPVPLDTGHSPELSASRAQQEFQVCRPGVQTGTPRDSGPRHIRPSSSTLLQSKIQAGADPRPGTVRPKKKAVRLPGTGQKGQVLRRSGHPTLPLRPQQSGPARHSEQRPRRDRSQAEPRPRWPAPVKLSVPWHKGAYIPAQPRSGVFSRCWCDECEPRTGGWGPPGH